MSVFWVVSKLLVDVLFEVSCVLKKMIRYIVWQWRAELIESKIKSCNVALGAGVGKRVLIENNVYIDADSLVDDYSYINSGSSVENAAIGKFCSIARDVMIGPAEHNYLNLSTHPFWHQSFYGFKVIDVEIVRCEKERTVIHDDVWIGYNAIIRRGVTIQKGAVIGAGSLVTKDVGAYEIWGGVPAKKIKQRFDQATIAELVKFDWCNLPVQFIENHIIPNVDKVDLRAIAALTAQIGQSHD